MKTDSRLKTSAGSRFRFLLRALGLTGLLAFLAGAVLASATWPALTGDPQQAYDVASEALKGPFGDSAKIAAFLIAISAGAVAVWLAIELLGGLLLVTGRKSGAGFNNALQMGLAVGLVVVVNVISFQYYSRTDATRDKRFTLAPELQEQLRKLDPKSPTTIVVLQMDKTSAAEPDRSDALSTAGQAKIVEKVRDLVEEIREFGPQFEVHVLHTKAEDFAAKLDGISPEKDDASGKKIAPPLRKAILDAPENSIFFAAHDRVQRLGFNGFYLLDKKDSVAQRNLVLKPQGKEAFVRKVLAVEARRPRVALAVIHPVLSTAEEIDEYSAPGLRKSLELNGYDVVDLITKKGWDGESPIGPGAGTVRESQFEEIEADLQAAADDLAEAEAQLVQWRLMRTRAEKGPFADIDRVFRRFARRPIDREEDRKLVIDGIIDPNIAQYETVLADAKKRRAEVEPKYLEFVRDDALIAGIRQPNVKARMAEILADCDLLIVSRLTVTTLSPRRAVPSSLHNLSRDQAVAIQDYLAAGKPIICCFGAADVGPRQPRSDEPSGPDDVEKLIRRLGIDLGPQIVVTDVEYQAMASQRSRPNRPFGKSPSPPTAIVEPPKPGTVPNPIAVGFDLTNRSLAGQLQVVRSGFRPVYVEPSLKLAYSWEILHTAPESWNKNWPETASFADPRYLPKFEATKPTDDRKGTRNEERKGSVPVGVAAEVPIPAAWLDPIDYAKFAGAQIGAASPGGFGLQSAYAFAALDIDPNLGLGAERAKAALDSDKAPSTVRLVVFGHGGLFNGKELDPGRETLLLQSVHWSLKRDDLMPRDSAEPWRYPRVGLSPVEYAGWRWGSFLGLPLIAAYLGLIVLMLRRLR